MKCENLSCDEAATMILIVNGKVLGCYCKDHWQVLWHIHDEEGHSCCSVTLHY